MIETDGLGKRFDSLTAVADVTFKVERGTLLVLLGPNGAGKTTTVRMLAALLRPTSGTAWVAGFNITDEPSAVRRHVGLLTEYPGLYHRMPGIDYLEFFGQLHGLESH
ncbi:MAG: ATP-binding cassette domain-containing protein, partial [Anaerolineales bacterium]|nr:ATP-binding cassette domain-containing protein [Anaerolineales bacterium]